MGNTIETFSARHETASHTAPFLRIPITDSLATVGHHDRRCYNFELRWMDCLEAYGPHIGKEKCKLLYQDFNECANKFKQMQRINHMKVERQKQWLAYQMGKGPKRNFFEECPPLDAYACDGWEENTFVDWYYIG